MEITQDHAQASQTSFYLEAGITKNVEMLKAAPDIMKTKGGESYNTILFEFQSEDGITFTHREFEINESQTRQIAAEKFNTDPQKFLDNKKRQQGQRVFHIMKCFVPEEKINIPNVPILEAGEKIKEILGESFKGVKVDILLSYDKKGFAKFPNTFYQKGETMYPFCVPSSGVYPNGAEAPELKIHPQYHKIEKEAPKDYSDNFQQSGTTTGITPGSDDLAF